MESFSKMCLSEEFVDQILLALPPKSLMRFQCVCNSWCNLIKSPRFVAKHVSRCMRASPTSVLFKHLVLKDKDNNIKEEQKNYNYPENGEVLLSSLNLCNEDDDDYLISDAIEDLHVPLPPLLKLNHCSNLKIVGHCDGIICLKLFVGNVILCNPAMKEFKLLPKSFLLLPNDDIDIWVLPYELNYYTEYLGFGYDSKSKDRYKVVRFVIYDESCYWFKAEVYTMGSNTWREIETKNDFTNCFVNWSSDLPIYLNEICYWHATGYQNAWGDLILSFDMGNEVFHEILIPDLPDASRVVTLAKWKEFIALFAYQEERGVPPFYRIDGKGSCMDETFNYKTCGM